MNLGDVAKKSVPKMCLVSPPQNGGAVTTRSFIPHRCHTNIGVLAAVSVANACMLPGSPAAGVAVIPEGRRKTMAIEHPEGEMTVVVDLDDKGDVAAAALLRTARKLFDGIVYGR
jgi:4-oxalomesaconate tautomerase